MPSRTVHQVLSMLAGLVVGGGVCLPARAIERGSWFWYQSSDPNGAANIVGNPTLENETISYLQQWQVTRLYGSYSNLPVSGISAMAAWNKKLAQAGIDSYVVLSDAHHILPSQQTNLQNLVTTRFVNFNNGRSDPEERFIGIEMDLEPHTLPQWDSGTNADRRTLLLNLRDAFTTVRQQVVAAGYASAELSAALPVWFDSSSSIGWLNTADRDQWFVDINTSLDAISLMAYENSSVPSILNSIAYEQGQFGSSGLLALRSKLGEEWTTYSKFAQAMLNAESQTGAGIDIESYYRLRQIAPTLSVSGDYNDNGTVDAADYALWRKGAWLENDLSPGNDSQDYVQWRSRFDAPATSAALGATNIPEMATAFFLVIGIVSCLPAFRRKRMA
jgi:hypothetical protein